MNASPRLQVPCVPPSSKRVRLLSGRYASADADASQNAGPDNNDNDNNDNDSDDNGGDDDDNDDDDNDDNDDDDNDDDEDEDEDGAPTLLEVHFPLGFTTEGSLLTTAPSPLLPAQAHSPPPSGGGDPLDKDSPRTQRSLHALESQLHAVCLQVMTEEQRGKWTCSNYARHL